MKWYKHDPVAFLEGVIGLDAEERGFYITVINLLYARNCKDVGDDLVCSAMSCRPQVWRRVKAKLVAKGKIRETDGKLTANRVQTECQTAAKLIENMKVLRHRQLQNQQVKSGDTARTTTTTTTTTKKKEEEAPPSADCRRYFFEAGPIKLTEADFKQWEQAFPHVGLRAELTAMADWASMQPKWFPAVSGLLGKREREIKLKIDLADRGPKQARAW